MNVLFNRSLLASKLQILGTAGETGSIDVSNSGVLLESHGFGQLPFLNG